MEKTKADIVERLREPMIVYNIPMSVTSQQYYNNQRLEAADHIDKQEADNKQLRSELLAAERIEYNDWTPSKGGRLG